MKAKQRRGAAAAALDSVLGLYFGLPTQTCSYTVSKNLRIPLRDEVKLAADYYCPSLRDGKAVSGTLLMFGPYGRGFMTSYICRCLAPHGYQVLLVSCRGTFGSSGRFDPQRTEATDAQDIVAWMREQDWYTGSFATIGASYLGYTQWALLAEQPRDMVAAVILVAPHDFSHHQWGTGALCTSIIEWADIIACQEEVGILRDITRQLTSRQRLHALLNNVSLLDAVTNYFSGKVPWLTERLTTPDRGSSLWRPTQHQKALENANIPILLITGWYDIFFDQTMEQYMRLRQRGCKVGLTIGPWTHIGAVTSRTMKESLDWLNEHMNSDASSQRIDIVRIFITGENVWRPMTEWPPKTSIFALNLQLGGGLSVCSPLIESSSSSFIFNPYSPTPSIGGSLLNSRHGSINDFKLSCRTDVLAFTSSPLSMDVLVLGKPRVELYHTTDIPYADIFIRVSQVLGTRNSRNVTETYKRLDKARPDGPLVLDLQDCAHLFKRGTRIRLTIAGGCHPKFARNPGTGEALSTTSDMNASEHRIFHDLHRISCIEFPVVWVTNVGTD